MSGYIFSMMVPVIDPYPLDQSSDILILSFLPYLLAGMVLEIEISPTIWLLSGTIYKGKPAYVFISDAFPFIYQFLE